MLPCHYLQSSMTQLTTVSPTNRRDFPLQIALIGSSPRLPTCIIFEFSVVGVVVSSDAPIVMSTNDLVAVSPDASLDAFGAVFTGDNVAASIHTFVSGLTVELVAVPAGASVGTL